MKPCPESHQEYRLNPAQIDQLRVHYPALKVNARHWYLYMPDKMSDSPFVRGLDSDLQEVVCWEISMGSALSL